MFIHPSFLFEHLTRLPAPEVVGQTSNLSHQATDHIRFLAERLCTRHPTSSNSQLPRKASRLDNETVASGDVLQLTLPTLHQHVFWLRTCYDQLITEKYTKVMSCIEFMLFIKRLIVFVFHKYFTSRLHLHLQRGITFAHFGTQTATRNRCTQAHKLIVNDGK